MVSKVSINPVTGSMEVVTSAKLIQVGDNLLENKNGTGYYPCTVEVVTRNGEKRVSALIYERNYAHGMELGKSYLCTVRKTDRGHLFILSHLPAVDMTEDKDFGFEEVQVNDEFVFGEDEYTF